MLYYTILYYTILESFSVNFTESKICYYIVICNIYSDEIPLSVKLLYDQNEEKELAADLYVRARTNINSLNLRYCPYYNLSQNSVFLFI